VIVSYGRLVTLRNVDRLVRVPWVAVAPSPRRSRGWRPVAYETKATLKWLKPAGAPQMS